jgi:hypothetical protein
MLIELTMVGQRYLTLRDTQGLSLPTQSVEEYALPDDCTDFSTWRSGSDICP